MKTNVIDITKRLKKRKKATVTTSKTKAQILSIVERRGQKKDDERRNVTRTVLSQFIGVFAVLKSGIMQPVSIFDISTKGLSFDMVQDMGAFNVGETVTLRIYMSHDTYFSFAVTVANHRIIENAGVERHGAMFKKNQDQSGEALYHFVRFLENVAGVARKDKGEKITGRVD